MEQIYKSLRGLVSPDITTKIAERLHVKDKEVSQAVSSIFAGFLVLTQINGDTPQIRNIFDEAGSLQVLSKIESVCSEPLTPELWSVGDNFLQHVLGDRAANFTTWISLETGLTNVAVNTLVGILAPVFVGYVGEKLATNQWSMRKLLGLISSQKGTYRKFIPEPVS